MLSCIYEVTQVSPRVRQMKATTEKLSDAKRNHAVEKHLAVSRRAGRLAGIRQQRDDGSLSQELFQVSQALILCGLPYQPTTERHFTRKARLADGSTVAVTFSTALEAAMPYGSDRTLLHFLMDRAVKTGSRFVSWETATEFLRGPFRKRTRSYVSAEWTPESSDIELERRRRGCWPRPWAARRWRATSLLI